MKKLFLLMAFFMVAGLVSVNAQCHGAKKAATTEVKSTTCTKTAAAKAAALDENIIERADVNTGEVKYVRKQVCPTSGKISYKDVHYSADAGTFVNVAPSQKASCAGKADAGKKGCCSKKAAAAKASTSCAGKAKAGCCSKKKADGAGA